MDNFAHDNLGVDDVKAITGAVGGLATSIKNKAQLKKAKGLIAGGKLSELTPHYVQLLIDAGVDPRTYENAPAYQARPEIMAARAAALSQSGVVSGNAAANQAAADGVTDAQVSGGLKKYLPYIIGILILGIIIWMIVKK